MLKQAALFFMGFAVACAGYLYSLRLETRVRKIEKILLFLSQIKTNLEFTAENAESIFSILSKRQELTSLPFVGDCFMNMKNGDSFSSAWNNSINCTENVRCLKKDDVALLRSFGASFGITDLSGQMRNCEMHEKLFHERLTLAEEERKAFSKPVKITGLLCGIAVMIIFM